MRPIHDFRGACQPLGNKYPHLLHVPVDRWRYQRGLITPQMTPTKLSRLVDPMLDAIDETMAKIGEKKHLDAQEMAHGLSMDILMKTILGMETNFQQDAHHPLTNSLQHLVKQKPSLAMIWQIIFPGSARIVALLYYIYVLIKSKFVWNPFVYSINVSFSNSVQFELRIIH